MMNGKKKNTAISMLHPVNPVFIAFGMSVHNNGSASTCVPLVDYCVFTANPGYGGDREQSVAAQSSGGMEGAAHQRAATLGHSAPRHRGNWSFHVSRQSPENRHHTGGH